jgi:hypothetical protein
MQQKLFTAYSVCGEGGWQIFQIIPRLFSMQQKLFHAYSVCGKIYSTPTEWEAKIIPRLLSMRQKLFHAY